MKKRTTKKLGGLLALFTSGLVQDEVADTSTDGFTSFANVAHFATQTLAVGGVYGDFAVDEAFGAFFGEAAGLALLKEMGEFVAEELNA